MPRMRCIDNSSYRESLTVGNIYDVIEILEREDMYRVTGDDGDSFNCFRYRFEPIEEEVPITIEYYTNLNQLSVGMKVIVRNNLEHIFENEAEHDPGYCNSMSDLEGQEVTISRINGRYFKIEEDPQRYDWCVEAFEPVRGSINTEEVNSVPVVHDFAVGDIVRVKGTSYNYAGDLAFVKEVYLNSVTLRLNISSNLFNIRDIEKVTEESINAVPLESLLPIPEYTQITETAEIKKGTRIKLPTRKTNGDSLVSSTSIKEALKNNCDYLTIRNVYDTYLNAACISNNNNFRKNDVETFNTNFVQGTIENGHRIKDNSGRTHTYEAYDEEQNLLGILHQTLITNNDTYIDYIDSTGWFVRVWKELVTKPRGAIQYTEYMAMCAEDYIAYKAQTEARIAYVKALIENNKIEERNEIRNNNINNYRELKRRADTFLIEERERIEAKRRKEERAAKLRETNALGIWKHHDKSWI